MTTYVTDSTGKFIPATQRPDGTWRKARRVKDGYVPQEEVPLYESKGKQFAARKNGLPPGMCPLVAEAAKKEREKQERAKARKQEKDAATAVSAAANGWVGGTGQMIGAGAKKKSKQIPGVIMIPSGQKGANAGFKKPNVTTNNNINAPIDDNDAQIKEITDELDRVINLENGIDLDSNKMIKKLRKKLREIDLIEDRIRCGELKKPEKEQVDKIKRKREVLKELKRLEEELSSYD